MNYQDIVLASRLHLDRRLMSTPTLFDLFPPQPNPFRDGLAERLGELAARNIYVGGVRGSIRAGSVRCIRKTATVSAASSAGSGSKRHAWKSTYIGNAGFSRQFSAGAAD